MKHLYPISKLIGVDRNWKCAFVSLTRKFWERMHIFMICTQRKYQGVHHSLNNVRFEYHILTPTMIINILGYVQHQPSSIKTNNPVLISRGKCKQFAKLLWFLTELSAKSIERKSLCYILQISSHTIIHSCVHFMCWNFL